MIKNLLSIIIPSRNEKYLKKTIEDLLIQAVDDIEIIAILDGYWIPASDFVNDKRVHYIHFTSPRGMRNAINKGVSLARGEFIMKADAHCKFEKAFDLALKSVHQPEWVQVPTRKRLDPEKWEVIEDGRPPINHMYLSFPEDPTVWGGPSLQGKTWNERNINDEFVKEGEDPIVDLMTAQGSCWFMTREYFYYLELMDEENYGEFGKEMQEIGLKCWLGKSMTGNVYGGRMVTNRNTWYAHWHKTKTDGRGYSLSGSEFKKASDYTRKWFDQEEGDQKIWHKQILPLKWLITKFWPVPGWPKEWIYEFVRRNDPSIKA